jgi:hypothetical protein
MNAGGNVLTSAGICQNGEGSADFSTDPGSSGYVVNGNSPTATGVATFNYMTEPVMRIEGTITFTVQTSATHRLTVITTLTCEE